MTNPFTKKRETAKPRKIGHARSGEAFPRPYTTEPMSQRPSTKKSGKLEVR